MIQRNYWRDMLINAPSLESEICPICRVRPATNRHHVVPKGMGGTSRDEGPTICVCGFGNTSGCHRRLHDGMVHLRYVGTPKHGHWEFAEFDEPTSLGIVMRDEDELDWKPAHGVDIYGIPLVGRARLGGLR